MMNDIAAPVRAAPAKWDPVHANDLGSAGSIVELNDFVAACFGNDCRIRIAVEDDADWFITQWEVVAPHESHLLIGRKLNGRRHDRLLWRIFNIMPLIAEYHRWGIPTTGRVAVNLEDFGLTPGLAFCENRPEYFLIPDPDFMGQQGYAQLRYMLSAAPVAWEDRARTVFWRGSDFGPRVASWQELPRVRLCQIALEHGTLFDVGITDIRHGVFTEEIKASGLMRDHVPSAHFNRYRAHIDIDGRSNAWTGLFYKLLSGSPVLKIASPAGYRQWYYDRLKPWINFVPVASDMSDLVDKARWLQTHDEAARQIGERGRALAMSLTYEGELKRACGTISAALRYFSGRPEMTLDFGAGQEENACLRDGWSEPEDGGVPATGVESRIELPRPIRGEHLVLTLDASPVDAAGMPATQRLGVVANGEILQQATLSTRQELRCALPRRAIGRAEKLAITLLHPDAASVASASRPLDTRMLSVTLHRLTLKPVSLLADVPAVVAPAASARSTRQVTVMQALYGRDIWHGFVPTRPRQLEIQGWNGRVPLFARLLDRLPNSTVIDVGVWNGQSTIFIAGLMRQREMDGCVVAIDTFLAEEHWAAEGRLFTRHPGGRPDTCETFLENTFYAGVADLVVPLPVPSIAAARLLAQRGLSAGLIHLDATRDYAEGLRDAEAYWPLVEPGGYLVGDDYGPSWPGVVKAADEFATSVGQNLEVHGPKWVIQKPTLSAN